MKNIKIEDLKEGLYIPSIEACWLYKENKEKGNYEVKEEFLKKLLRGKLDWCYELAMSNLPEDIEIKKMDNGNLYTLDIINVKYKKIYKGKDGELSSKKLRNWSYAERTISIDKDMLIECRKIKSLRKNKDYRYSTSLNFNNNEIVNWKRSGGKARVGQDLFIKKDICKKALDWSRMDLQYTGKVDIASIRAYESLPLSSIMEELIEINPKNILVVEDFESVFPWKMSETWLEGKKLETETREVMESNSIWDGEGLLSKKIFDKYEWLKEHGVALLRNRFLKCAGFNAELEEFYSCFCDRNGYNYETYELKDIFGNLIKVKDIELITTPSSIKINKSNKQCVEWEDAEGNKPYEKYGDKAWLYYWRDKADNRFGIAKIDKPSHLEDGRYQRLSYQMNNTIPYKKDEMKQLVKPEIEYINRLKNDLEFFMAEVNSPTEDNYLNPTEDENEDLEVDKSIDVNSAFVELVKRNNDFQHTQVFKDYRRNFINSYINTLRKGKVKIEGDYCIACGNPLELLYSTVGEFNGDSLSLKNDELYCARFEDGDEVVGFRNPHTNSGSVSVQVNRKIDELETYFKCTNNIVFINSIKYPILSTYSGMDFDIDSILLTKEPIILNACKRIKKETDGDEFITPISVNRIKNTGDNLAVMNGTNMAKIDHIISQNYIGGVVNLSQEINSLMNHLIYNKSYDNEYINELYNRSSKLTSISNVEIDKAKKQFEDLDVPKELENMKADLSMVDENEIRGLRKDIEILKEELQKLRKEILKDRRQLRKPILKQIREIKEANGDNIKILELQNEIEVINIYRQGEMIDFKILISQKRKQISKLDSRRLKPRFFKYVGDNESKKAKNKVNKNYKRKLYKETIEKYAIEKGITMQKIDKKDKELIKLLKDMDKKYEEWKDRIYVEMDTPMDWLEAEIDTVNNKKKVGTVQVIQLIKKSKHSANENIINMVVDLLKDLNDTINSYKANEELSYKDRGKNINYVKEETIDTLKKIKITKADMTGILKRCLNTVKKNGKVKKKSGIESLTLEILFSTYGKKLLDMFVKGGDSQEKKVA
ncbi:hypothetical protein [Clostridium sp. UBA4395]|uniref:hypothetical protein n=1 Tax=Clostridium sp. UBA4395 TaxID=1946360 RepID=UPI003216A923